MNRRVIHLCVQGGCAPQDRISLPAYVFFGVVNQNFYKTLTADPEFFYPGNIIPWHISGFYPTHIMPYARFIYNKPSLILEKRFDISYAANPEKQNRYCSCKLNYPRW